MEVGGRGRWEVGGQERGGGTDVCLSAAEIAQLAQGEMSVTGSRTAGVLCIKALFIWLQ